MRTTTHGRYFAWRQKNNVIAISFFVFLFLTSCSTETLFKSNFDPTPVNQPPANAQAVGTARIDGPSDAALVVSSPVTTGGKWVQITRHANATSVSGLQCNFTKMAGAGLYNFSAIMFIPKGSKVATVQFESFGQPLNPPAGFLHLDFIPDDNTIRLDDDEGTKFGHFPNDSAFIVQVTLNINATTQSAHIVLAGAGASGIKDYNVLAPFRLQAQQFGAARLWMGFPHTGSFDATTILVTRRNN
ncbi:MAG: hypothetical protein JST75_06665 [Bacteroidetes bacterium]|nr:hypothetical protein [Bacteroidota bacterium]